MTPFRTRKRRLWLVTWDYVIEDYFLNLHRSHIAATLSSRVSRAFVRRYLPLLYATERQLMAFERCDEMCLQSEERHKNPDWKPVRSSHPGWYEYGSHPWLTARLVNDFFIDVCSLELEVCYWTDSIYDRDTERWTARKCKLTIEGKRESICHGDDAIPPKKVPRPKA